MITIKNIKKQITAMLSLLVLGILLGSSGCGVVSNDGPPDATGPEPKAHEGVFVSADATFTFSGDGKTVYAEFDAEYLKTLDNPPNETEYSYTFTWYSFGMCRYDVASELQLYHEESETSLIFSIAENASEDKIVLSFPVPGDENQEFVKQ